MQKVSPRDSSKRDLPLLFSRAPSGGDDGCDIKIRKTKPEREFDSPSLESMSRMMYADTSGSAATWNRHVIRLTTLAPEADRNLDVRGLRTAEWRTFQREALNLRAPGFSSRRGYRGSSRAVFCELPSSERARRLFYREI